MFRERIRARYGELTPSFRKLADFILQHQLVASFMTATELARRMEVDAATVVRFAQYIGYSGFRELIKEVQEVVKEELAASYSADLEAEDDVGLFRSLLENERNDLALAQARLTDQANVILPTLLDARRVWVTGQGCGAHLAALCASTLRGIGFPAVCIAPNPTDAAMNLRGVGVSDVVIGFSLTGMDLDVANAVSFARRHGARTFVFSVSPVTAAALAAETVIICPASTQTPGGPSFTGLAAMIVALAAAFGARYPEEAAAMKAELQQSYQELLELQARSSSELDVGVG